MEVCPVHETGKLYVYYGDNPEEAAYQLMERMDVAGELAGLGKKRPLVAIKPNLVVAQPAAWGATTEPGLVRGVVSYLLQHGYDNLVIMESAWVGDSTEKAFEVCGYRDIEKEFSVSLLDLKKDKGVRVSVDGLDFEVCARALEADYLINMPVLKAHCQTRLTCALKNLKGCVPDREKRRFHRLGLHRPIACLNKALRAHLTIVDGIIGDLSHEEGGTPVRLDRVIGGRDPVLVDAYAAGLIGYRPDEIPYIGMAEKLGVGKTSFGREDVLELNSRAEKGIDEKVMASREVDALRRYIDERQACSACFGSLVHALRRLKEKGKTGRLPRVAIGQGWRGKSHVLGVGECTKKCEVHVPGCPPPAAEIVKILEEWQG